MGEIVYGFKRHLAGTDYEKALERVTEELKKEGFGILTEIDVKETLKKKLGKDFRRYKILGACNPPFAYQALERETDVGVFMPCNVVVYEDDARGSYVTAIDPRRTMASQGNEAIQPIAEEVARKLKSAVEKV